MIELVVDTNIIVAAILKYNLTRELVLNQRLKLYAPEELLEEIELHFNEFLYKSKLSNIDFRNVISIVTSNVVIVNGWHYADKIHKAQTTSPDTDDVAFFALALSKNCPLWTNDKKLREQTNVKILSTYEVSSLLNKNY